MFFAVGTLEPVAAQIFVQGKFRAGQEGAKEAFARAVNDLAKLRAILDPALDKGPYVVGEQFSAADIMLGPPLYWANQVNGLEETPSFKGYLTRLMDRPAFQKTFELRQS